MSAKIQSTYVVDTDVLIVEVNCPPSAIDPDGDIVTALRAEYPSAAGYVITDTTLNQIYEICALNPWAFRRFMGLIHSITERTNADGSITRTFTITQP